MEVTSREMKALILNFSTIRSSKVTPAMTMIRIWAVDMASGFSWRKEQTYRIFPSYA
jgi:hypothetical protein